MITDLARFLPWFGLDRNYQNERLSAVAAADALGNEIHPVRQHSHGGFFLRGCDYRWECLGPVISEITFKSFILPEKMWTMRGIDVRNVI
jgi:hypothetical protein